MQSSLNYRLLIILFLQQDTTTCANPEARRIKLHAGHEATRWSKATMARQHNTVGREGPGGHSPPGERYKLVSTFRIQRRLRPFTGKDKLPYDSEFQTEGALTTKANTDNIRGTESEAISNQESEVHNGRDQAVCSDSVANSSNLDCLECRSTAGYLFFDTIALSCFSRVCRCSHDIRQSVSSFTRLAARSSQSI